MKIGLVPLTSVALMLFGGCSPETSGTSPTQDLVCDLDPQYFVSGGVGRDGIPALTDPELVTTADPSAYAYLAQEDRVIGFFLDGEPVAVPHNILWHHEIMNLNGAQQQVAVSYCPLTGTSLVFDRASVGGAEFGVSGLLYQANLIMYDRNSETSLWPQMFAEARCGPRSGNALVQVAMFEMTWEGWEALHPTTKVVATPSAFVNYSAQGYPYGTYESLSNQEFLGFPIPTRDPRVPVKERVFGIPGADGGVSLPFSELDALGTLGVVELEVDGVPLIVFWDGAKRAAGAFSRQLDGSQLALSVVGDTFQDEASGSVWSVTGEGVSGVHAGRKLDPVAASYVAFWGAWSNFNPDAALWLAP